MIANTPVAVAVGSTLWPFPDWPFHLSAGIIGETEPILSSARAKSLASA